METSIEISTLFYAKEYSSGSITEIVTCATLL